MTTKKYYSLRELSQELDIPKSTIVKYKEFYPEFFRLHGEGKRKKFDETALEVLGIIREQRENAGLDWMEIKDLLREQFGKSLVEPEQEQAPAAAPAAAPEAVLKHIDHMGHLFTALTGEVVRLGERVRRMEAGQVILARNQKKQVARTAGQFGRLRHDMEAMFLELINRDAASSRRARALQNDILTQFAAMQRSLDTLTAMVRVPPPAPESASPENLKNLEEKIEQLAREGAFNQSKYQMLLRENEKLKEALQEIKHQEQLPRTPQAMPQQGQQLAPQQQPMTQAQLAQQQAEQTRRGGGGILGIFRKQPCP